MDSHCTSDRPSPSSQNPTGVLTKLNDVDVYISKPADYPHSASKLLLLLTPGTGVKSTNNQLQADRYASEGFVVVMPDQFEGDAAPNTTAAVTETGGSSGGDGGDGGAGGGSTSIIEQVKLRAAETAKSFMIDMWLARHTPEKVLPILHKVLASARDEFADAVANGGGVYAAGYCFGGKYVAMLAADHPDPGRGGKKEESMMKHEPMIKAGAIAHATLVTREDLTDIKVPISMVCVENDPLFPEDILEHGRKHLSDQNIEHEIKTYPGVPHGFAVVGEYGNNPDIKDAQTAAFDQMLSWLKAH